MEIMNTLSPNTQPQSETTMWFIKQFQVWRAILANRKKGAGPEPSKRVQCVEQLRRLTPERFIHYHPSLGLGVQLKVCYKNVDVYAQALREASLVVREERPISPNDVREAEHVTTLDRFLTSSDGFYLVVPDAVAVFRDQGLQLCEAMESSDYVTHGLPEHNLRMLTKLLSNVHLIATHLNEVSRES
jgi:hypothetical protein